MNYHKNINYNYGKFDSFQQRFVVRILFAVSDNCSVTFLPKLCRLFGRFSLCRHGKGASEWRMEYDVHDIRPISVHNKQTSPTQCTGSRGRIFIKPTCRLRACIAPQSVRFHPFISLQFSFMTPYTFGSLRVPCFFFCTHILLIFRRQPFFVCAPSHASAAHTVNRRPKEK